MRQFGGEINCESVHGEFTEFILSFPALKEDELSMFEEQIYRENRVHFAGKRLLVADHDESQTEQIVRFLKPLGLEISVAADGLDALVKISAGHYDLLLCEVDLPEIDCYRLTHFLKGGTAFGKSLPIVVYSPEPHYLFAARAEKTGISKVLSTPLMLQPLVSALSKALAACIAADEPKDLSEKKVLVVDDSSVNRTAVRAMLKFFGIENVVEATNGLEALDIIENMNLDLLLLDIQMPLLDGLEVAKRIRKGSSVNRMIPIVAMSGESDRRIIMEALDSGMNAYIVKPVNRSLMKQKIVQVL
jgi:CheY-like chemotaxis protein